MKLTTDKTILSISIFLLILAIYNLFDNQHTTGLAFQEKMIDVILLNLVPPLFLILTFFTLITEKNIGWHLLGLSQIYLLCLSILGIKYVLDSNQDYGKNEIFFLAIGILVSASILYKMNATGIKYLFQIKRKAQIISQTISLIIVLAVLTITAHLN